MTFAAWLLAQSDRTDDIGALARAAAKDSGFPRRGDPDDVRARVRATMADGDVYATLSAAIVEWNGGRSWTRPVE